MLVFCGWFWHQLSALLVHSVDTGHEACPALSCFMEGEERQVILVQRPQQSVQF